ncbi:unnamed protein product [Thlaspi arvense]|uniref:At2g35280-like TPR domain-containing protein n=1 Tax=Thlaspi arvense TaxID=13288 RepID=A0AAU9SJI8_THLAR|nr:unnamed protein product [Thlaspi arvense]
MAPVSTISLLEDLPQDLLGDIISRAAESGRLNVRHCMEASMGLAKATEDKRVHKKLNLRPLAFNPLATLHQYEKLMEKCLENGNAEAHYIEGIKEYFYYNNITTGLHHLQATAEGSYDNGIYLYGIIMLCRGQTEEGKNYLDLLGWQKCKRRADRCWRNIQRSLHVIPVIKWEIYRTSLRNIKPSRRCKLNDMDTRCNKCYYYKQMKKFMTLP